MGSQTLVVITRNEPFAATGTFGAEFIPSLVLNVVLDLTDHKLPAAGCGGRIADLDDGRERLVRLELRVEAGRTTINQVYPAAEQRLRWGDSGSARSGTSPCEGRERMTWMLGSLSWSRSTVRRVRASRSGRRAAATGRDCGRRTALTAARAGRHERSPNSPADDRTVFDGAVGANGEPPHSRRCGARTSTRLHVPHTPPVFPRARLPL